MKKILIAFSAVIAFSACQKEPSFVDPAGTPGGGGSGGTTNGTRLVKVGSKVGTDSITSIYNYTSGGLINSFTQSGTINGTFGTASLRAVRNNANVITSTIIKSNAFTQFGLDSIVVFHTYDAAKSRYKYSLSPITIFGSTETDSVLYNYDAAGKLIAAIDYLNDGSGYTPYSKEEYTYAGANISTIKSYSYDDAANKYDLEQSVTHEYDSKKNPLLFPADAPVLNMEIFYPANNPVKSTTIETGTPSTTVRNIVYTYNAASKPVTAVSSGASGTPASVNTYYYQ